MPLKIFRRPGVGNWYVRGTVRGQHVYESTGTDSKKSAEEYRAKREADLLEQAVHGKRAVATFLEAAVLYLEAGGDARFVGHYDEGTRKWTGLIGHFGEKKLSAIGQIELDVAARSLYPKASPETRNRQVYTPFIAIWKKAELRGLCEVRRWERPRMAAKPRDRWATVDEVERMVAAAAWHLGPLVVFLAYTGARMSEAMGLDWSDVDETAAWVVFRETKRKDEDRGVPLHPCALEALKQIRHREGRVFLTPADEPYYDTGKMAGGQVKTAWAGMCRRAGVAGVTPHTMRHTFSTWLTAAGVTERIRDELMGHSSTDTGRRYAHVPRAELVAAVSRLPLGRAKYVQRPTRKVAKTKRDKAICDG